MSATLVVRDTAHEKHARADHDHQLLLDALRELAGGIAARVNLDVSPVAAHVANLRRRFLLGRAARRELDAIQSGIEATESLMRELAVFAGVSSADPKVIAVDRMVNTFVATAALIVGPHIGVRCLLAASGALIHADLLQMREVLLGMMVAGRDAMPAGGVLTVETTVEEIGKAADGEARAFVALRVSDTGPGLDEATRMSVAVPSAVEIAAGRGLGLARICAIVRSMGGELSVNSQLGRGTTYALYLPANRGPHVSTPPRGNHVFPRELYTSGELARTA